MLVFHVANFTTKPRLWAKFFPLALCGGRVLFHHYSPRCVGNSFFCRISYISNLKRDLVEGRKLACATDETRLLVKSVCETAPKSLSWSPTCVPGFEYVPWIHDWLVKTGLEKSCRFANQYERKFETLFRQFVESVGRPEQGSWRCCFAEVLSNRG